METEAVQDQVDQEAAFASTISGEPLETKAPAVEEVKEEAKPEAVTEEAAPTAPSPIVLTAEEVAEFKSATSKVNEFQAELRKAHGRIGALNDQLHQALKAKEAEGKPAVLTPMELKRTKEQFPELYEFIGPDIEEAMASLRGQNPEAIKTLVSDAIAAERQTLKEELIQERKDAVAEEHPDAKELIESPDFSVWAASLPEAELKVLQTTNSPNVLIKKLTAFKGWKEAKDAAARRESETKQASKERLAAAVTPKGVGRAGQNVLSDREAAEKAFAEAINT